MPDMAVPSLADGMGLETDFEEAEPGDFSTSRRSVIKTRYTHHQDRSCASPLFNDRGRMGVLPSLT